MRTPVLDTPVFLGGQGFGTSQPSASSSGKIDQMRKVTTAHEDLRHLSWPNHQKLIRASEQKGKLNDFKLGG